MSTDKQADHGVSLDAQRTKVDAYASLYEIDVVEVIVDGGVSASTLDRPGLSRALDMLRTGDAEALLVTKLDRLTRSVRDLGELIEKFFASGKSALLSVSEHVDTRTASGRMILRIMATISEWEREAIGERTAEALRHKRSLGEHTGGDAPFGWRVGDGGVQLEPVAHEQQAIAEACRLRDAGLSLRAIARALDDHGHRSRLGRRFSSVQVRRMIRRTTLTAAPTTARPTSDQSNGDRPHG